MPAPAARLTDQRPPGTRCWHVRPEDRHPRAAQQVRMYEIREHALLPKKRAITYGTRRVRAGDAAVFEADAGQAGRVSERHASRGVGRGAIRSPASHEPAG